MTVVNKFNVNKQQVTLDADIIENMSANDVSYDASTQYNKNTVGDKLSELKSEVIGLEKDTIKITGKKLTLHVVEGNRLLPTEGKINLICKAGETINFALTGGNSLVSNLFLATVNTDGKINYPTVIPNSGDVKQITLDYDIIAISCMAYADKIVGTGDIEITYYGSNYETKHQIDNISLEINKTNEYINGVKTIADIPMNGQESLSPTEVDTSLFTTISARLYDQDLVLQGAADVYSAVEVDVSTMIGNDITFSCYGGNNGHSGFVDNFGRVIASYQDKVSKKTLRIPSNAKYLRFTYATSLSPTLILNISHNKSYSLDVLTKKVDSNDSEIIKVKEIADYSLNVDLPSIQTNDKISESTIQSGKSYNSSLQPVSKVDVFDTYELDVENYVGVRYNSITMVATMAS